MSHTPLPWGFTYREAQTAAEPPSCGLLVGPPFIAQKDAVGFLRRADLEFIWRAVNCHEDLVAACEAALEALSMYGLAYGDEQFEPVELKEKLTAALAKARG